jgi:hypothetical protein
MMTADLQSNHKGMMESQNFPYLPDHAGSDDGQAIVWEDSGDNEWLVRLLLC